MIKDLLDFYNKNISKEDLNITEFALDKLVYETIDLFSSQTKTKNLTIIPLISEKLKNITIKNDFTRI